MATNLTIADAAKASGLSAHTLRYYERAVLLDRGAGTERQRMALLEAHRDTVRASLAETAKNLELIEWKINYYREQLEHQ
ncbi:MAG TPA: MerR family DNA-binding transcriptional regulator [Solirubrobacteraceae bacterium]|jgi:DNA-binding transcriptional MerR regulator|nr:MerR family DNA-binding transcriptional regulator [Solirubrobacteraceae bacterium]